MPSHGYDSSSAVTVAGELPSDDEHIGDATELHKLWDTMNFDVKARCEVCFALESMASTQLNHSLVLRRISMGSLGSFMNKKTAHVRLLNTTLGRQFLSRCIYDPRCAHPFCFRRTRHNLH